MQRDELAPPVKGEAAILPQRSIMSTSYQSEVLNPTGRPQARHLI